MVAWPPTSYYISNYINQNQLDIYDFLHCISKIQIYKCCIPSHLTICFKLHQTKPTRFMLIFMILYIIKYLIFKFINVSCPPSSQSISNYINQNQLGLCWYLWFHTLLKTFKFINFACPPTIYFRLYQWNPNRWRFIFIFIYNVYEFLSIFLFSFSICVVQCSSFRAADQTLSRAATPHFFLSWHPSATLASNSICTFSHPL